MVKLNVSYNGKMKNNLHEYKKINTFFDKVAQHHPMRKF